MEKARTTPDAYPLSLNGLVTGCNQKSNRHPVMNLSLEAVEDAVTEMRQRQLVGEVHGGGRVAKYRHYGYDFLGVKGVEAAVMTELLLRGEQTAGEIRTRASRFEPIADLSTMHQILDHLIQRGIVIALTPEGRGQLFSHNLYEEVELERLKQSLADRHSGGSFTSEDSSSGRPRTEPRDSHLQQEVEKLQAQMNDLQAAFDQLIARVDALEHA